MRTPIVLLLPLILSACILDTDYDSLPLRGRMNEPLSVGIGQTVVIEPLNIEIGFREVMSESRCPIGLACFWEGVADLKLALYRPGQDTAFVSPQIFGYVTQNDTAAHRSVTALGIRVTLLQLDPYPRHGVTPPPGSYVVMLKVSQVQ